MLRRLHIDIPLFTGLVLISALSLMILYSTGNQQSELLIKQGARIVLAFVVMTVLPESSTDFIFAVFAEEYGLLGCIGLLALYAGLIGRGMFIAIQAQDSYSRLLAGGLTFTFFVYVFVNIGMVIGILPVVGVPLPLISYGGTSMVTLMAGFGILMSIHTHRKFLPT